VRIIAGAFKGRQLLGPAGAGVRPTSDRLRETLFNVLAEQVSSARVLDGFAGTGAVGLEALSRGASHVTFIERDPSALSIVRDNVTRCGAGQACMIIRGDFMTTAARPDLAGGFDVLFLDPPYGASDLDAVLHSAAALAASGAQCVVEHGKRHPSPLASGWQFTRLLPAGDSALSFYTRG
jgi:16S rRNA (guanine966-N2)-methyltransferase